MRNLMSPDDHNVDVDDVTELVFFNGYDSNEAATNVLDKVRKLDGCLRYYIRDFLSTQINDAQGLLRFRLVEP